MVEKGQCFPLSLYDKTEESEGGDLFQEQGISGYRKKDGIGDTALIHFQSTYPGETIIKEDLFYYLYGILHSEDYRDQFRNNLIEANDHACLWCLTWLIFALSGMPAVLW